MQWDYLLNDQLRPDKTEGMTNPKITPFLMCPATVADALGGTPAANDAGGGHIKKGGWVSAHEAAVRGLLAVWGGEHSGALPCGCRLSATLTDEALLGGAIRQGQVIQRELSTGHGDENVSHTQLDLLLCVCDLVEITPARSRLLGKGVAVRNGELGEVRFEVHPREFTRG